MPPRPRRRWHALPPRWAVAIARAAGTSYLTMLHPYVGDLSSPSVMLSLKSRVVDWHTRKVRRAPLPVLALFGPHAMSDLSPECAPKRTSADHSELMGSRPNLDRPRPGLLRRVILPSTFAPQATADRQTDFARRANHLRVFVTPESSPLCKNISVFG